MSRYPSAQQLMASAVESTGLGQFGHGDFVEGLEVLLDSLATDAQLCPSTDDAVVGVLRRRLENRLRVEQWRQSHPAIDDVRVEGPVHVIGLPRTGTTALGSMLSLDPQFRCLRMWEQRAPVPPPVLANEPTDPRRLAYIAEIDALTAEERAKHLYEVDATVEDSDVLGMAFHGQQYTLPVYGYHRWWRTSDCTDTFAYHRRVVELLGSNRPPALWLFKAPHHKFHLDSIVKSYPGARFVFTHRSPLESVPSYASFVASIFPASDGELDRERLGREVENHLREGMVAAIEARGRIGEDRFLDVHHRDLIADPMGTVAQVYGHLGLTLPAQVEAEIDAWQTANRSGAHGTHRYTPQHYGLRPAEVREAWKFYEDRFNTEVDN
ncbi:MAG: sulfotransferase [Ilumatobacter sp.]|nr:MAG: sulfotransferase [Ilumatobacter sp.]